MNISKELHDFSVSLRNIGYITVCALIFVFVFLFYPLQGSVVERVFSYLVIDLVPKGVQVVSLSPFSALIAATEIAAFLAGLLFLPLYVVAIYRYIAPGMREHERKVVEKTIIPSLALFVSGTVFSYFWVIPPTLSFMYRFSTQLGTEYLLEVSDFIGMIAALCIFGGVIFLLPVVMILLSLLGVVDKRTWIAYARHAVFVFLVISAIITPDGTGITMLIFSVPMVLLYGVGCVFSRNNP